MVRRKCTRIYIESESYINDNSVNNNENKRYEEIEDVGLNKVLSDHNILIDSLKKSQDRLREEKEKILHFHTSNTTETKELQTVVESVEEALMKTKEDISAKGFLRITTNRILKVLKTVIYFFIKILPSIVYFLRGKYQLSYSKEQQEEMKENDRKKEIMKVLNKETEEEIKKIERELHIIKLSHSPGIGPKFKSRIINFMAKVKNVMNNRDKKAFYMTLILSILFGLLIGLNPAIKSIETYEGDSKIIDSMKKVYLNFEGNLWLKITVMVFIALIYFVIFVYCIEKEHFHDKYEGEFLHVNRKSEILTDQILKEDNPYIDWEEQYKICISSEQFYEKTMWGIGQILMAASISIIPLSLLANNDITNISILFSWMFYLTFLLIANRLRTSIRLYRNAAMKIEKKIDALPLQYVYNFEKNAFGHPLRIWAVLVLLFQVLINIGVFVILYI